MFLGLTVQTWIAIASVAVPLLLHINSGGTTPVISPILNTLLGQTPATSVAAPQTPVVLPLPAGTPTVSNHPVLNNLLAAVQQLIQAAAAVAPPAK